MKSIIRQGIVLTIILFFTSCFQDTTLSIDHSSIAFTNQEGSQIVMLSANKRWQATSDQPWCRISPSSGNSDAIIKVECDENASYDPRKCTLSFSSAEKTVNLEVVQSEKNGILVSQANYQLSSDSQLLSVDINANVDFIVEIDDKCKDWILFISSQTKSFKKSEVVLGITANKYYEEREGRVLLKQKNGLVTSVVTIKQNQADWLVATPTEFNISNSQQELTVEVKSNVAYEVYSKVDWVSVVETKGLVESRFTISVSENDLPVEREGVVEFLQKNGELSSTICIKQEAAFVPVSKVSLNKDYIQMFTNSSVQLKATIEPENATDKSIQWFSSNTEVASVSLDGLVSSVSLGESTITAVAGDIEASCEVIVIDRPIIESISLNYQGTINAYIDQYYEVGATISPIEAKNNIRWISSNERVAEVIGSGPTISVHTKDFGSSIITAEDEYSGVTTSFIIQTIITDFMWAENTTDTYMSYPLVTIGVGSSHQLSFNYSPTMATHIFEDFSNFVFYELSSVVEAPSIISIDSEGLVTGIKAGIVGIKPTGNIISYGSDRLYIRVVDEVVEIESNDEPTYANRAIYGLPLTFSLSSSTDVDWFILPLQKGGETRIKITASYSDAVNLGTESRLLKYEVFSSDMNLWGAGSFTFDKNNAHSITERNIVTGDFLYLKLFFDSSYPSALKPSGFLTVSYEEL